MFAVRARQTAFPRARFKIIKYSTMQLGAAFSSK
jgi:hypothetical protein